jgi:hypothetical protein
VFRISTPGSLRSWPPSLAAERTTWKFIDRNWHAVRKQASENRSAQPLISGCRPPFEYVPTARNPRGAGDETVMQLFPFVTRRTSRRALGGGYSRRQSRSHLPVLNKDFATASPLAITPSNTVQRRTLRSLPNYQQIEHVLPGQRRCRDPVQAGCHNGVAPCCPRLAPLARRADHC